MQISIKAALETLRSKAAASITNSYTTFGAVLSSDVRMFRLVNPTDGDLFFSIDGTNNHFFVPANSFVLYDLAANRVLKGITFCIPKGTQFYIKYSTAPTIKSAYMETVYGVGEF